MVVAVADEVVVVVVIDAVVVSVVILVDFSECSVCRRAPGATVYSNEPVIDPITSSLEE